MGKREKGGKFHVVEDHSMRLWTTKPGSNALSRGAQPVCGIRVVVTAGGRRGAEDVQGRIGRCRVVLLHAWTAHGMMGADCESVHVLKY